MNARIAVSSGCPGERITSCTIGGAVVPPTGTPPSFRWILLSSSSHSAHFRWSTRSSAPSDFARTGTGILGMRVAAIGPYPVLTAEFAGTVPFTSVTRARESDGTLCFIPATGGSTPGAFAKTLMSAFYSVSGRMYSWLIKP